MSDKIGKRLSEFAKHKGLTNNKLGSMAGMSSSQISQIIRGANFRVDKLVEITKVHKDLNIVWLLTGQGDMLLNNKSEYQKREDLNLLLKVSTNASFTINRTIKHLISNDLILEEEDLKRIKSFRDIVFMLQKKISTKQIINLTTKWDEDAANMLMQETMETLLAFHNIIDVIFEQYKIILEDNLLGSQAARLINYNGRNETISDDLTKINELLKETKK